MNRSDSTTLGLRTGPPGLSASPAARQASLPFAARTVLGLLARIAHGSLEVALPDGRSLHFGVGEPRALLCVLDWRMFRDAMSGGDTAFAEGYLRGDWASPDPAALLTLLPQLLSSFEGWETVVFGVILMVTMIFLPKGLVPSLTRSNRSRSRKQSKAGD